MGADQSRPSPSPDPSGSQTPTKPDDFYTLLHIEETATDADIKKAFRKQALIWHPDKNAHRVQESTAYFSKLQEAYEILSDPQERAWYDRHRHDAPAGSTADEPGIDEEELNDVLKGKREKPPPTKRGVGTKELLRFFEAKVWKHGKNGGMNDEAGGFFQVYNALFHHLAQEENLHSTTPVAWPPFGSASTPWSLPDRKNVQARNFYNAWSNFVSEKSFDWVVVWEADRTDERRVKRLLEKDNKKARDEARREYTETVRELVAYLRKRDPRVPKATPTTFPLGPRSAATRSSTSKPTSTPPSTRTTGSGTTTPAGAAPIEEFTPQDWQNVSLAQLEAEQAEEDEAAADVWECVVCGKEGRSEGRWKDHERSRGHLRGVERLRREMRREDKELGLSREGGDEQGGEEEEDDGEEDDGSSSTFTEEGDGSGGEYVLEDADKPVGDEDHQLELDQLAEDVAANLDTAAGSDDEDIGEENEEGEDGEGGPMRPNESKKARKKRAREEREAKQRMERELKELERENRRASRPIVVERQEGQDGPSIVGEDGSSGPIATAGTEKSKKELRREREAKKKAAAVSGTASAGLGVDGGAEGEKCNVCKSAFASRTKLFDHIKKTGHALAAGPAKLGAGGRSGDWDDEGGSSRGGKKKGKRK